MKPVLLIWFVSAAAAAFAQTASPLAGGDAFGDSEPVEAAAKAPPEAGRFQMAEVGSHPLLLDTATGRMWQVSRRTGRLVLEPVMYQHAGGVEQPLPDFQPEPAPDADLYLPDPELEAERVERAHSFVTDVVGRSIMRYAGSMGRFPPSLAALTANLSDSPEWQGPYLRESPIDPWGNRYRYLFPGERNPDSFDVWSLGPDGRESDDDIGNW